MNKILEALAFLKYLEGIAGDGPRAFKWVSRIGKKRLIVDGTVRVVS